MPTPISEKPTDTPDETRTTADETSGPAEVSTLGSATPERLLEEVAPLEVDDSDLDADLDTAEELDLEAEATAARSSDADRPQESAPGSGRGSGRLTLALTILLMLSIAVNLLQWRAQDRTEALADDYEVALTQAVEKLDEQTVRALTAEDTLSDVDSAMGKVRNRIAGLQEALEELATAAGQ